MGRVLTGLFLYRILKGKFEYKSCISIFQWAGPGRTGQDRAESILKSGQLVSIAGTLNGAH